MSFVGDLFEMLSVQMSPCCAAKVEAKPTKRKRSGALGKKYNRKQQVEVERARMRAKQRAMASQNSLEVKEEEPLGTTTSEDAPSSSFAPQNVQRPMSAPRPPLSQPPDEDEHKPIIRPTFMAKLRSMRRRPESSGAILPEPRGTPWYDLVALMPLVDAYDENYFEERLKSFRPSELKQKCAKGGNNILHYSIERNDPVAIQKILARITDPHDQLDLVNQKNDAGFTPNHSAMVSQSNTRYAILRAFDDVRAEATRSPLGTPTTKAGAAAAASS